MRVIYSIGAPVGGYGFSIPAYHGARALAGAGALSKLICTGLAEPLSAPRIVRVPAPRVLNLNHDLRNFYFDKVASLFLERADVLYGWSTHCLHQLRKAHRLGMRTIVDRGSAEPRLTERLLHEAHRRARLPPPRHYTRANLRRTEAEFRETDLLLVPSTFVRESLLARGVPRHKIAVLPLGVDPARFHPAPEPRGPFRALTVGNLGVQKGTHLLLDAHARLPFPSELVLAGPVMKELRGDPRLHARGVRLTGLLPHPALPRLYAESHAFALPSIQDGFGMVVLEAMAAGRPVVISENVGAKDLVRHKREGLIVPAGDAAALRDALEWLHDHPRERRRMGAAARRQALRYPWTRYEKGVVRACERLARR